MGFKRPADSLVAGLETRYEEAILGDAQKLSESCQLLGTESNDIDVAVQDMTGISFANRLTEFLKSNKNEFVKDPIIVEANPDQSKHLETAKMKLWDIELDLVNLRAEEYAEESRIPNQIVCSTLRDLPPSSPLIISAD
jgi:hypothetical protein